MDRCRFDPNWQSQADGQRRRGAQTGDGSRTDVPTERGRTDPQKGGPRVCENTPRTVTLDSSRRVPLVPRSHLDSREYAAEGARECHRGRGSTLE